MSADLNTIRTKIRRLTRSLSESQLSTTQIDDYINTFVLYDFPEHLRLANLKETFSFYTEPYIDTYDTKTAPNTSPLYNFKNKYITVHQPVYVAGYRAAFFESRANFFANYPFPSAIQKIGVGDGIKTNFTGTIPINQGTSSAIGTVNLLKNNVLFNSVDSSGNSLVMIDVPTTPLVGTLVVPNTEPPAPPPPVPFINYTSGAYDVTFVTPPAAGKDINVQYVTIQPSRPQSVLFYDGAFTVRPTPDQAYKITMDVFVAPTALLESSSEPKLQEWWQLIAYGAARKVFQDRMDMESLQIIDVEYREQMLLVNRRTIVQQTSQRTPTIYDESLMGYFNSGWFNDNF